MAESHTDEPAIPAHRLVALGDGVFAIVMTLLVFQLGMPDVESGESLGEALVGMWPDFAVYALSFMVLGVFWVIHHVLFDLVERYEGRMLNIHPSLLPKHRGLDTYRRALEAGDAWHGSTVHFVIPELDAGPSIIQYRVPVRPDDDEQSLRHRVQKGEYQIYPQALGWLASGRLKLRDGLAWLDDNPLAEPVLVEEPA